jgi:hypothetical protein
MENLKTASEIEPSTFLHMMLQPTAEPHIPSYPLDTGKPFVGGKVTGA